MKSTKLCALESIPDGGSLGATVAPDFDGHDVMIVRQGDKVYAYWNECPHTGAPLDWLPDSFLDEEEELIVCAVHGARFTIEEGKCVSGPCAGASLSKLDVCVERGDVVLIEK